MTENEQRLRGALLLILDNVDYMKGACAITEMIGAVLPPEVLELAHAVLDETRVKR